MSDSFLTEREREIAARAGTATHAPWSMDARWPDDILSPGGNTVCRVKHPYDDASLPGNALQDREFIAHAREDVPYLLGELEEARRLVWWSRQETNVVYPKAADEALQKWSEV